MAALETKKIKSFFLLFALGAILLSCNIPKGSLPNTEQLISSGFRLNNHEKELFNQGRILALTECSACHRFFYPYEYSPDNWNTIICKKVTRLSLGKKKEKSLQIYFQSASQFNNLEIESEK